MARAGVKECTWGGGPCLHVCCVQGRQCHSVGVGHREGKTVLAPRGPARGWGVGAPNLRDGKDFSALWCCAPFSSFLDGGAGIGATVSDGKRWGRTNGVGLEAGLAGMMAVCTGVRAALGA